MTLFHISPLRCMVCGNNACYEELPICSDCISFFQELITEKCKNCGKPAYNCGCYGGGKLRFVFFYKGCTSKRIIRQLKENTDIKVIDFIAEIAVEVCNVKRGSYDGVAYVPRHRRNLYRFGSDQSEEFAKAISRRCGIPVVYALKRVGGREQKLLSHAQRLKNIKNRYIINENYNTDRKFKKILLVDDIYTTGATVKVCAGLLRKNAARAVSPLTISKTNFRIKKGS